ncbi:activated protein kinase catalytic subunit alpha-1 [Seminavis robusta]|uniref:guanylate cyclase n=1 Tax=Seminavis robusta TaxID=568900 RepID=A0A9N8E967_9STRA|nr:activated protein kinase catalytic subunit alpha-1 [Seminavis robusta]|eukprot:Sro826_g207740.1 activated protein kinase catalytic subunit alpha-1 (1294) ;mRNA; r:28886-34131
MLLSARLLAFWCATAMLLAAVQGQANEKDGKTVQLEVLPPALNEDVASTTSGKGKASTVCHGERHPFDPRVHKRHYKVGIHAIRGLEAAEEEYKMAFETYLTQTAGRRFDPPVDFTIVAATMNGIFEQLEDDSLDFLYVNPGVYSCVGVEFGANPLATIISRLEIRGLTWDLDVFGGVIFTRSSNYDINTIEDLRDKIIGAGSISMIMAGQLQFYEMQRAGLSYVMDPKQVVFTYNQDEVVQGVVDGIFDAGFVRTEQLERSSHDINEFKVLHPRVFVMDDGSLFPFLHSTDIYPEWPVAALPHVPADVAMEVQEALLAFQGHAEVGKQIQHGNEFAPQRCDTTEEVAQLAWNASIVGEIAGFRNPMSYFEVRTMHEAAVFIKKNDKGDWTCTRANAGSLYDSFDCPEGYYKLNPEDFKASCPEVGLSCKEGYDCYCKPCIEAHDVDVFECYHDDYYVHEDRHLGCDKMDVCGSIQQRESIQFRVRDNLRRAGSNVSVIMHLGRDTEHVPVTTVDDFNYKFNWTHPKVGEGIMEVSINGVQIPDSPFQVEVLERDCDSEHPGHNMRASADGECVCSDGTFHIAGNCISSTIVAIVASLFLLFLATIAGVCLIRYKMYLNDKAWVVAVEELHFDEPPEVIGQGSFGVVLKAEYRGTQVAIKQAIKTNGRRWSNASGSREKSQGANQLTSSCTKGPRQSIVTRRSAKARDVTNSGSVVSAELDGDETRELEDDSDAGDLELGLQFSADTGSSGIASFGFLRGSLRKRGAWDVLPFGTKHDKYHVRFRDSVLGHSASATKKDLTAMFCPWFSSQARREEDFMCEMRVLSRLRHPCITTVMGAVVSHSHTPMLLLEFMEYGSLYDLLRNDSMHLAGDVILQICRDVAQGLRYLHSSRPPVFHGDMKAKNILVDSRMRAKLCDFGLSDKTANLVTGTPYWMAPEYLTGRAHYDCSCDIYSMGIIIWEIYARKNPYEGDHLRDVLRKVCNRRVNKRPEIDETFPPKMVELMKKCWSADPLARPHATTLDTTFLDMNPRDAEPLEVKKADLSGQKLSDELFPADIAAALKAGQRVDPEQHELVTVIFSDIVGFHRIYEANSPEKVCNMLGRLFQTFEKLSKAKGVFKVETVGDNYMGVTNLNGSQQSTHVKQVAEMAVDMVNEANKVLIDEDAPEKGFVSVLVGFHSGPVVSNVIGSLNPRYGLFGDTVNTASRMASNSRPNRILCSEYSYRLLREQVPEFPSHKRGKIQVKGKGTMTVFWVGGSLVAAGRVADRRQKEEKKVDFALDDSSRRCEVGVAA